MDIIIEEERKAFERFETSEIIDTDRQCSRSNKKVNQSQFEIRHSRNTSHIQDINNEELKLKEMKQSTRSANIDDEEGGEETKEETCKNDRSSRCKSNMKNFA